MKLLRQTFLVMGVSLAYAVLRFSQTPAEKSWHGCEEISGNLDLVGTRYSQSLSPGTNLIVLAGISNDANEASADESVKDAIKYLAKFHNIPERNMRYGVFKFAEGRRTTVLEFFVKGDLVASIRAKSGSRLCFGMGETFSR